MHYQIKLPVFEGPFDLLLFFIERDEVDIYNIPIARITDDFLVYIREMEELNIDLASEFVVMAATLMRIKARMLLPRKELDEQGNEIDPREELTRKLVAYRQYKEVVGDLHELEAARALQYNRGYTRAELHGFANKALLESEWESLTLFKLLKAYQRVLERMDNAGPRTVHQIRQYEYTIQDQQEYILQSVQAGRKAGFDQLFGKLENRIHAIITFLALLELLNLQQIAILQSEDVNQFWITAYNQQTQ